MPTRVLVGAMCVQRFDDSLNSAIHITYRISLRSSSMPEPRDPLLKVLTDCDTINSDFTRSDRVRGVSGGRGPGAESPRRPQEGGPAEATGYNRHGWEDGHPQEGGIQTLGNDPSAGSPTETLLRLLLPLTDRV